MDAEDGQLLRRLDAEAQICGCINRHALASDILDEEMWKSTYWPDAREDHGWYRGNAHEFVERVVIELRSEMDTTSHHVSNFTIVVDGDRASAISYFLAYCRHVRPDGTRRDSLSGGRYIDKFERRDDTWKIADRITKADWIRMFDDSMEWGSELRPGFAPRLGSRDADDPVRILFELGGETGAGPGRS